MDRKIQESLNKIQIVKNKNYYQRHMTYKEWYEKGGRLKGCIPFEEWAFASEEWIKGFREGSRSAWLYQANMWGRKLRTKMLSK